MTIEDIREYKKNAVEILRKHDQYATAKAVEEAFMSLACLEQHMWERDVAISQLNELGLSLGQNVDNVKVNPSEIDDLFNIFTEIDARYTTNNLVIQKYQDLSWVELCNKGIKILEFLREE